MKALALFGGGFVAVGFALAMQTALTPQSNPGHSQPVDVAEAPAGGGCCAKKPSTTAHQECKHDTSEEGCKMHSPQKPPSGCTRDAAGEAP